MKLTLAEIAGRNTYLNQRILVIQQILAIVDPERQIPALSPELKIELQYAILLWDVAYIVPRNVISQDSILVTLYTFKEKLLQIADDYANILEKEPDKPQLPMRLLTVGDRRFITIIGAENCLDIKSCQVVPHKPVGFEGVSYNLATPVEFEWLRIRQERTNGTKSGYQAGFDRSNYPGIGPAGHSR